MRGRDTEYVKPDNIYREKADAHAKRDHIKKKKKRGITAPMPATQAPLTHVAALFLVLSEADRLFKVEQKGSNDLVYYPYTLAHYFSFPQQQKNCCSLT